jgi:hypothetical protein
MRLGWLQTATDAIRRNDRRNAMAGAVAGLIAGLGAATAIGAMEWLSLAAHYPLVVIPFATSIVLVIGSPEAEPACLCLAPMDPPPAVAAALVVARLVKCRRRALLD